MERDIRPEIVVGISLGLLAISLLSFPKSIKRQVRQEQDGQCAKCAHKPKKLEIHHIIPESISHDNSRKNAIGLDHRCHKIEDEKAFEIYGH